MGYLSKFEFAAAGVLGLHSAAFAQEGRSVEINLTGRALYDSNIARSSAAVAASRGLVQEDVRLTPGVDLRVSVPVGRTRLYADGGAGYDFHRRNTRLDRERVQVRTGLESSYGRCIGTAEGQASRQQSELEDIILGPVSNAQTIVAATLSLSCPRDAGFYPTFSVTRRTDENSQRLRKSSDRNTDTVQAGLVYTRPTFGELSLIGRYTRVEFPNRPVAATGGSLLQDGFEIFDLGAEYRRALGSVARGSARLAYTRLSTKGREKGSSGTTYGTDITFLPDARIRPHLVLERRVEASNRIGILYQTEKLARLEALMTVSPAAQVVVGASVRDRNYRLVEGFAGRQISDERTVIASASLDVAVSPRLRGNLYAIYEKRDADLSLFDYRSKRVGLSTTLGF
jgi:hypothetical protein